MTTLLDVNVLVALAWPNHIHHTASHRFFAEQQEAGWATCPLTQSAFVRLSSNRRIFPDARSPREAILVLQGILELPGHKFWHDDLSIADPALVAHNRLVGASQITDAHLLGLALRHGGAVATFDRGILEIVPEGVDPREAVRLLRS